MEWNPQKPYDQLPLIPPEIELETKEILKLSADARVALEALRNTVELIPNQTLLLYTLPILEAQSSSAIENIVTTTDTLFKYLEKPNYADPATKGALRYRSALFKGMESIQNCPLSLGTAKEVCSVLRGTEMDIRHVPGIHLENSQTKQIIYTPPSNPEVIFKKISNWEKFVNSDMNLDPLVSMAIAHYQFEAIHPFSDGNGRTGRVLNILYLVQKKLLNQPILYLSRYIINNKAQYYDALLGVTRDKDWIPWLKYMIEAVRVTSIQSREKVLAIRGLEEETIKKMKNTPNLKSIYSRELIDLIFSLPYVRVQNLVKADIVKRQTASRYLRILAENNVLKEIPGTWEKIYLNQPLLDLLTTDN